MFDFDEENWKNDVIKFFEICLLYNIEYLVEILRLGKGVYFWMFFENVVFVKDVRKLGCYLFIKIMMILGLMSFKLFDRMFFF